MDDRANVSGFQAFFGNVLREHRAVVFFDPRSRAATSSGHRLVFQEQQLIPLQLSESECAPFRVEEFDFKNFRRKDLDHGSHMAAHQAFSRLVHQQRNHIQKFDRIVSHGGLHST